MKLETLDIAGVYHYNDEDQDKFFDALAATDKFEYFELRSIQLLIDFNYPVVQKYLLYRLFFPYLLFLVDYLFLVFYAFENRFDPDWFYWYWTFLATNVLFATYFLNNEMK